jgi:hypothetical protein
MIRQMHIERGSSAAVAASGSGKPKRYSKHNSNTLEYGIIAHLVIQQYLQDDMVRYDALLSIPVSERIPGLMETFGKKTMHRLLLMILKEFMQSVGLPRAKRMTETKLSMAACELMLSSYEDQLSLEDLILFLQRAKDGKYGSIKNLSQPSMLFDKMEEFRQARHEAWVRIKEEKALAFKENRPRTSNEPTQIGDLLQQAFIIDISNRA